MAASADQDVVIVIMDGLRQDYVQPQWMPRLTALAQEGAWTGRHHAAYPSSTRVQASTIGTGSYPARHGLVFNTIPMRCDPALTYSAAKAAELQAMAQQLGEPVLTNRGLGEYLADADIPMLMIGTGSQGTSWLVNAGISGMGVINAQGFIEPESLARQVIDTIGPPPAMTHPNVTQAKWAVDAYLKVALRAPRRPRVTIIWFNEPDKQQHTHGVGSEIALEAVKLVDTQLGCLIDGIEQAGLADRTNLMVLADHGFSDGPEKPSSKKLLKSHGLLEGLSIAGNALIYVPDRDATRIRQIVEVLQADPSVGPIFTQAAAPGSDQGHVPGTLSLSAVGCDHATRGADVLTSPNWSDALNDHGFPGGVRRGHSTLSPYEMQVRLTVSGPAFKRGGLKSDVPTGHIDLGPTVLHLMGLPAASTMDGRVLQELLADGPDPQAVEVCHDPVTASTNGYQQTVDRYRVGQSVYLSSCTVQR